MSRVPTPLTWKRRQFAVLQPLGTIDRLTALAVNGLVAGPFAIYPSWSGCGPHNPHSSAVSDQDPGRTAAGGVQGSGGTVRRLRCQLVDLHPGGDHRAGHSRAAEHLRPPESESVHRRRKGLEEDAGESQVKTATFTVHADSRQSARWKQAAEAEGFPSAGAWLAAAADAYLKVRARAGLPVPLAWRKGVFRVEDCGETVTVRGHVSPPFGVFAGTPAELAPYPGRKQFTLVFIPTRRVLATLRSFAHCKALASELARLWYRGDGAEPSGNPAPVLRNPA
jgi:hypothetical protein